MLQLSLKKHELPENLKAQIAFGKRSVISSGSIHSCNQELEFLLWGNNMEASGSEGTKLVRMGAGYYSDISLLPRHSRQQDESEQYKMSQVAKNQSVVQNALTASSDLSISDGMQQGSQVSALSFSEVTTVMDEGLIKDIQLLDGYIQQVMQYVIPIQAIPPSAPKKRKSRKRPTPIVDDEVKRSARISKNPAYQHMELDAKSKPRKQFKEDTVKMQEQLDQAIIDAIEADKMLPLQILQDVAINFCQVPPEEITEEQLLQNKSNVNTQMFGYWNGQYKVWSCFTLSLLGSDFVSTLLLLFYWFPWILAVIGMCYAGMSEG